MAAARTNPYSSASPEEREITPCTAELDSTKCSPNHSWTQSTDFLSTSEPAQSESHNTFSVSESHPVLEGRFTGASGETHYVEVYIVAVVTTKMMICVDGQYAGGDRLGTAEMFAKQRMQSRLAQQRAGARLGSPVAVPVVERSLED